MKVAGTVGVLSGTAETAAAQQSDGKRNELLVGIAPSANARQTAQRALPSEARIVGENDTLGYVRAELPERNSASTAASVASTVASRRGVEYAEPNAIYETLAVPNDPRFGDQYAPEMVNTPAAWDTTYGDGEVTIAVVDQGIKDDHPDLEATVASDRARDFVDDDDDPYPNSLSEEQHGTHVAGIAAAGTNNDTGVAGISNATLLSVRALDETGSGSTADIADGIQWAADNGADIINLSLGGGFTETLQKAVSYANEEGVLLVAAAGNNSGSVNYPAAYDECIAVSALDPDGNLASYSSRGPEIELAAPGTNLLSTWTDDGYNSISGTSMAAPVVSGVAALVLSQQKLSNEQVRSHLKDTAVDTGLSEEKQGAGRVDALATARSLSHTLKIDGRGPLTEYDFTVSGDLTGHKAINGADVIDGLQASGNVGGGRDVYAFSGEITDISVDGPADIYLDGEAVTVAELLPNVLKFDGRGPYTDYEFSVDGNLVGYKGINSADDIDPERGHAAGGVGSGRDVYAFSGEITDIALDGPIDVYLNGEAVTVAELLPNVLKFDGRGPYTDYEFSVDGNLVGYKAINGADNIDGSRAYTDYEFSVDGNLVGYKAINGADNIDGSRAAGGVGSGRDIYAFSGDLTDISIDGPIDVYLNGDVIDVSPDHTLKIDGTGPLTEYIFSVSGDLAEHKAINGPDSISGPNASGSVGGGRDVYAFSGEITDISVDGPADIYLDGEAVTVAELLPNVLELDGQGPYTDYEFSVDGNLVGYKAINGADNIDGSRAYTDYEFSVDGNLVGYKAINGADNIDGSRAAGGVGSGRDIYAFSGELTDISLDGAVDVYLNEELLRTGPKHVLSFDSNGGRFSYEFTVDANLEKSTARGATIDDNDTISDNTATGQGGGGGTDSYTFSGELRNISVNGDATVYLNGTVINGDSPAIGVHNGLSDANFDTIDRMETWQNTGYDVQNLFVPWNPDEGHMNWLFDRILPQIWNAGRTPLITWEPYTPGARTASVDTQSLVERNEYDAYIESLADTTPDDIEVRIGDGDYDGYIDRWASRLQNALSKSSGRQAYLRLAHEMNGDWYPWSPTVGDSAPQSYVRMWRHVHDQFDRQGIGNDLQWMWCVNAEDVGSYTAEQLYPGNGYVDWQGVDGYNWGRSQSWSSWDSPDSIYGGMLDQLSGLGNKPICVAEFASSSKVSGGYDPQRKDEWIRDALAYFENQGVDMWCWFNEDKETDWAVFNGVRGTGTVTHNGQQVNAYSAYREAIDSYATASGATMAESNVTEQVVGDD
ncbi:serine protease halolysin R4 [Halococcus salifodinae DSM 8989]|uniref:Serine protease halolysin R4 n=1 Tax=Halococcus salifodinae DSM 8989 TaxID=1227456 RepID=M0N4P4_9EURY|nr:serine protease halolysin R4 [Halococcus salifodinae DSM 8989]